MNAICETVEKLYRLDLEREIMSFCNFSYKEFEVEDNHLGFSTKKSMCLAYPNGNMVPWNKIPNVLDSMDDFIKYVFPCIFEKPVRFTKFTKGLKEYLNDWDINVYPAECALFFVAPDILCKIVFDTIIKEDL